MFATKRVFYKHRDNNFFPSWSYVCGMALVQVPQSTLEALLYTVTVYFLANLTRTGDIPMMPLCSSCSCGSLGAVVRLLGGL